MTVSLAIYRSGQSFVKSYLSVVPLTSIFVGQVAAVRKDADTFGIYEVDYTPVSGSYTEVVKDMTFSVGSAPGGADLGYYRVRKAPSSTVFYTEELSEGECGIVPGVYITAYREWRLWHKKPRLVATKVNGSAFFNSFTEYHDYDIAYAGQNAPIKPIANVTGSAFDFRVQVKNAGFTEPGVNYRDVTLSAAYSIAPSQGDSINGYVWDVGSETIISGTSTSATITVRVSATNGVFRWFGLRVTSALNGASDWRRIPIWVHDSANPPIEVDAITQDQRGENGVEATVEFIYQSVGTLDAPIIAKGAGVCLWEEAEFSAGDAPSSYLHTTLGWIARIPVTLDALNSRFQIEIKNAQWWLSQLQSFEQTYFLKSVPTDFYEMSDLSPLRVVLFQLGEYSTAYNVCNVYANLSSPLSAGVEVSESSVWGQINEISRTFGAIPGSDRQNGIHIVKNLPFMKTADRSSRTVRANLTTEDWTANAPLEYIEQELDRVAYMTAEGSAYSPSNTGFFMSAAPGRVAKSVASGKAQTDFQYLENTMPQDDLNWYVGQVLAYENNPNANVQIRLLSNMDIIEPAWNEPITLTFTDLNIRSVTLNAVQYLVETVSVQHSREAGAAPKDISWTLRAVTTGSPGEFLPMEQPQPSPENPFPKIAVAQPVPEDLLGRVALITKNQKIVRTNNYGTPSSNGGPNWTAVDFPPGLPGSVSSITVDPFSPFFQTHNPNDFINAYIVSMTPGDIAHTAYLKDIFGTPTLLNVTTHLGYAFQGAPTIQTSKRFKGQIILSGDAKTFGYNGAVIRYLRSLNYGSSWLVSALGPKDTSITPSSFRVAALHTSAVAVSPNTNKVYTTYVNEPADYHYAPPLPAEHTITSAVSSTFGASWSDTPVSRMLNLENKLFLGTCHLIEIAPTRDGSDSLIYYATNFGAIKVIELDSPNPVSMPGLFKNGKDISPTVSNVRYPNIIYFKMSSLSPNILFCFCHPELTSLPPLYRKNFLSKNGGDTWEDLGPAFNRPDPDYSRVVFSTTNPQVFVLYRSLDDINSLDTMLTTDGGKTFDSQLGNAASTGGIEVVGIVGGN